MSKVNAQTIMEYLTEFISENGNKKLVKLWEEEEKENVEKMIKKLVSASKKSVKPKKVKDPEAPKKKSAWIIFCEEERERIKQEVAEGKIEKIPPKEMFAELGKRWKLVKDDEDKKAEFEEAAKVSKEEYEEKIKTYVPKEGVKAERKKRAKKDKNAPKGAKSAWVFFCEAERKKIAKEKKKLTGKEVMAELSARWKDVKGTKKAKKYEEMAKKDKKRYEEEMEDYTPPEDSEGEEEEEEKSVEVDSDEETEKDESDNESEKTEEKEESDNESEKESVEVEEEEEEDEKPMPKSKGKKKKKVEFVDDDE